MSEKEIVLTKHLKRTMLRFNPEEFKRDYPSLYEGIMRAMEDYGDLRYAKGMYEGYKLCEDDKSRDIQPNRY
jgi:hypothetical protein